MDLKRGDVVTVALQGEQGKPRPALVIQSDRFSGLASTTLLPLTGTLVDAPLLRIPVQPTAGNGLVKTSHVMVDKLQTPSRSKIGEVVGRIEPDVMAAVDRALMLFLGLA